MEDKSNRDNPVNPNHLTNPNQDSTQSESYLPVTRGPGGFLRGDNPLEKTPSEWNIEGDEPEARRRREVVRKQRVGSNSTRHGLLASIPMVCRDSECPYKNHCPPQQRGEVIAGSRCVLEISKLLDKAESYYREFNVDPVDPTQRVDSISIKKLLMAEIMMERCEMLLADNNLIELIDVAMNQEGDTISQPQLHKADDALRKWTKVHSDALVLLAATRKDKIALQQAAGQSIDAFTKLLTERSAIVLARAQLMKEGRLAEADQLGLEYGVEAHRKLEAITSELETEIEAAITIDQEEIEET